jgi:energy-coupling factor transporter transmembrane protein EcfT
MTRRHSGQRGSAVVTESIVAASCVAVLLSSAVGFTFLASWAQAPLAILAALTTGLAALGARLPLRVVWSGLVVVLTLFLTIVITGMVARPTPLPKPPLLPAPKTEQLIMRVYGDDGKLLPGLRVTQTTTATDCIRSLRSGDIEALRCFTDPVVYDPCWINFKNIAACLENPWSKKAVLVRGAHPEPHLNTNRDPGTFWALELANGERCSFSGGATGTVAGMRINYDCTQGSVLGDPDRSGPQWLVRYHRKNSTEVIQTPVLRAWL